MAVKKITGRLFNDNGASATDGLTSDSTLTGMTDPGALVTFTEGRKVLGTTKADSTGKWTFKPAGLSDGQHSIVATASDGTRQTASAKLGFTLDTKASVTQKLANDTGAAGSDGVTKDATLTGKTDPGATVTLTEGGKTIGTATADRNGNWTFKPTGLADGQHSILATTKDLAGNSATSTLSFKLDTKATLTEALKNDTGSFSTDGITKDATLAGTAEAGATVVITAGFKILGTVKADAEGKWTFNPKGLADGQHSITATTSDAAGNVSVTKIAFTLDTKAPAAPSLALTDDVGSAKGVIEKGATTDDATPTLAGKAEAGATVSIWAGATLLGSAKAGADGAWSFTPETALANGSHSFTVKATDAAGNISPVSGVYAVTVAAASDVPVAGPITDPSKLPTAAGTAEVDTVVYSGAAPVGGATPYVLPQATENFDATGTGAVSIAGNALNNVIGLGMGALDKVDLSSGGSDRVTGTAAELNGSDITGFATDDALVVEGARAVKILQITAGSAVLHLDTDGDDAADTTIRLEGEGLDGSQLTTGDFQVTSAGGGSVITFAPTEKPAPTVSVSAGSSVSEGGGYTLSFTLSAAAAVDQVVTYTVGAEPEPRSVTIQKGRLAAEVTLAAPQDQLHGQAPAAVAVTITKVEGGALLGTAQASITVQDDDPAPSVSVSAPAAVPEGASYALTFTLSAATAAEQVVTYTVAGEPAPRSVKIAPGQTEASVTLAAPQDQLHGQAPAAVAVTITKVEGGALLGTAQASITVQDDDPAPSVASIQNATASEADESISIPVTLSHAARQDVTLTYEVSAPGKVIGFDGTGPIHKAISAGYEGLRWTGISSSGDGGAFTATTGGGQIQALDQGALSVTSLSVSSASPNQVVTIQAIRNGTVVATETVTLGNGNSSSASVTLGAAFSGIDALQIDGSANSYGDDWPVRIDNVVLAGGLPTTGTVTIAAGQTSGSIVIPVVNDSRYEVGETVHVRLTDADGATLGSVIEATGSITNDDAAPLPVVSITNVFTKDVGEGQIQEFEVTRDARIDEALTVQFESALFGDQAVEFKPGEAKVWATFGKANDQIAEPNQPYEIKLAPGASYLPGAVTSVSGMYIDDDGGTLNTAPKAWTYDTGVSETEFATYGGSYSLGAYAEDAEGDKLTYTVLSQPEYGTIGVNPSYGGLEFTPNPGVLDTLHQGKDLTFSYQFTVSDGKLTTAPTTGKFTIYGSGNPAGFVPEISVAGPAEVTEGGMATYTLTRTGTTNSVLTVPVTISGSAAEGDDFEAPLTATFGWGSATAMFNVQTKTDTSAEAREEIAIAVRPGDGYTVGASAVTALLDKAPVEPGGPTAPAGIVINRGDGPLKVAEGGATATFTIALASAPTADVTVVVDGDYYQVTPIPGDPYGTAYFTFTSDNWNVPQTVTVTAVDDLDPEEAGTGGLFISTMDSADADYDYLYPPNGYVSVAVADNDGGDIANTAPSALAVAKDTYDTDLSVDVEGAGYDMESGVTYEILSQPSEGKVTLLEDGKTFHFEGNASLLEALNRGEIKPVTFQYRVSDGELVSEPASITINVHGTNPGDETIQAFTRTTHSQTDFFPLDGGDGNDTVVFHSVTLTSGTGLEISLGKTIKWTEYDGKPIANIENITIKDTNGHPDRTMTVGGDDQANVITIENTSHKLTILGRGGDDTVNFKGTGNGLGSVINGGAGNDTVNAYSAVTVDVAEGNDTVNVFNGSNLTVQNFTQGDKIDFAAGIQASNVSAVAQGADTVLTVTQGGVTSTVTVVGATGLVAGTDWTASGTAAPPPAGQPVINAVSATGEVTEGGIATFTFTRTGDLSQPLTVAIDASVGSAVPGQDFTAPANIVFAAGSETATFEVQTLTDAVIEDPATIEVRIVPGAGYTVGAADGNVTDLIDGGDAGPTPVLPSISINDVEVNESAGTASFLVTLSAAAAAAVSVDYATGLASGPASTFTPKMGTLTFAPGETTKVIEVGINDNVTVATGPQKLVVNLSNVSSGATLADLVGEGTILDDDLPTEMPALTIATTTGLNENSTLSWNAIPGAASYVLIGVEPDEPNFPPHTLGFAVAPNTSFAIKGNDEFVGMVVTVEARDANGNPIARSENQTDLIENINDAPTGRPLVSDNTPEVGQLLTVSIGDLEDGDGMRVDRPDEFGYIWQRSADGVNWSLVGSTDSYQVTSADIGYVIRGGAQYADRGDTLETVFSLVTAKVGDPNPNTPPVAFDDAATTSVGEAVTINVLGNDFDFENDAKSIEAYGQGVHGSVTAAGDTLVYTPGANFVGTDTFTYTLNGGDTAKVAVTVTQPQAGPFALLTVDNLDEDSTLSWSAVPGAVSYVLIGLEPDDPTAPPHELGFALAPSTSFNINGDDEFAGMAIHVEARDANGVTISRSVNETTAIENINDVPTGNLSLSDMTPEVGQALTLGYGTFEDGDGYRDRGRPEEFEWSWQRSQDGVTWATITTGQAYTVTQADTGFFIRGRAIYEDRAGDTIETVYSLATGRVGAPQPGEDGNGGGGDGTGDGGEINLGGVIVAHTDGSTTITEGATTDTFTVKLADAPTSDVTVQVSTGNPFYALTAELVFTPETWNVAQTVTVTADDDFVREAPEASAVSFYTASADQRYDGLVPDDLPVTIMDGVGEPDPMPYVSVGYFGGDVVEGGEITFNFMRSGGVNTNPLDISVRLSGIDAEDIAATRWNGVQDGVHGFRAGSATATMTLVLADDALIEATETLSLTVLMTPEYFEDTDYVASVTILDNDVAPPNIKPVVESKTLNLSEDQMTAEIKPVVTDAEGKPTVIKAVGVLPTYVTLDAGNQTFVFSGDASAFDHLDEGETAAITFQYVANDGTEDSDPGTITININGITDAAVPRIDPEPAQFVDPYNYDQGNGGPAGQRTAGDDILNDGAGLASTIQGYGGNDTIYGRDGDDALLVGGNGNDTVHGGSGNDTINGDGGGAGALNPGASGSDWLYGGDGMDSINGQDGNDVIIGGHGADSLTGGLGDDTFVFHDIFDRGDTIVMQGQQAASDVFDFRSFDFDPNAAGVQGAVNGFRLFNQVPVAGQMLEDAFYYDRTNGRLSLDTGTDGLEDFAVTLHIGTGSPMPQINSSDFLI